MSAAESKRDMKMGSPGPVEDRAMNYGYQGSLSDGRSGLSKIQLINPNPYNTEEPKCVQVDVRLSYGNPQS